MRKGDTPVRRRVYENAGNTDLTLHCAVCGGAMEEKPGVAAGQRTRLVAISSRTPETRLIPVIIASAPREPM